MCIYYIFNILIRIQPSISSSCVILNFYCSHLTPHIFLNSKVNRTEKQMNIEISLLTTVPHSCSTEVTQIYLIFNVNSMFNPNSISNIHIIMTHNIAKLTVVQYGLQNSVY